MEVVKLEKTAQYEEYSKHITPDVRISGGEMDVENVNSFIIKYRIHVDKREYGIREINVYPPSDVVDLSFEYMTYGEDDMEVYKEHSMKIDLSQLEEEEVNGYGYEITGIDIYLDENLQIELPHSKIYICKGQHPQE